MAEELQDLTRNKLTKQCFDDPSCELSKVNGVINKMHKEDIRIQLRLVALDERGVKEVIKKRLKNYYKKQKMCKIKEGQASTSCLPDYFCIIDFEATCEETNADDYIHEIIEFPAVLVDGKSLELIDEFHEYCKPAEKPELSKFCQDLTGITQEIVDAAESFPKVLENFNKWLVKHKLGTDHTFTIVTDGPWDLLKFLPGQCTLSNIPIPRYAAKWINLRKHYIRYYRHSFDPETPHTLESLVEGLGMSFEGRPHSGMDDSRNIARMLVKMMRDGLEPKVNGDIARYTNNDSKK